MRVMSEKKRELEQSTAAGSYVGLKRQQHERGVVSPKKKKARLGTPLKKKPAATSEVSLIIFNQRQ